MVSKLLKWSLLSTRWATWWPIVLLQTINVEKPFIADKAYFLNQGFQVLRVVWKVLPFLLLSVVLHWVDLSKIQLGLSLEREEAITEERAWEVCHHRLSRAGCWPAGSCQREKTTFSSTSFTNQQASLLEQLFLCEVESWEQTSLVVQWLKKSPTSAGDAEDPMCCRATKPACLNYWAPERQGPCVTMTKPTHHDQGSRRTWSPAPAREAPAVRSPHTVTREESLLATARESLHAAVETQHHQKERKEKNGSNTRPI